MVESISEKWKFDLDRISDQLDFYCRRAVIQQYLENYGDLKPLGCRTEVSVWFWVGMDNYWMFLNFRIFLYFRINWFFRIFQQARPPWWQKTTKATPMHLKSWHIHFKWWRSRWSWLSYYKSRYISRTTIYERTITAPAAFLTIFPVLIWPNGVIFSYHISYMMASIDGARHGCHRSGQNAIGDGFPCRFLCF